MLQLKNIKKDYTVADSTVHALKGISLRFRQNEFVSILGQSGCGKTTLLNIIGGLDKYTDGDLIICGKSTKDYTDRDWDTYRNHRIGFIFQSYNLIPHQTILANVELALTIGGMSASERRKRAEEALKRVGLGQQLKKYPNQLSGGQMQRVAIARALVNDPEILLADEPTGALDTETSIQIMDLIREIAKERLVIMVTHNPELAEKYSTRIVRLLDGQVIEDSNPYTGEGYIERTEKAEKTKRTNMSFLTSLSLSAKNLWSKKGRTAVTSIAGSIGIIGVCLVLALSAGIRGYIDGMQDDMLSGNPVSVSETSYNLDALTDAMDTDTKKEIVKNPKEGTVYINSYIESLAKMGSMTASMLIKNVITQEYVDYVKSMPTEYYSAMSIDYGIDVRYNIFTDFSYTGKNNDPVTENMSIAAIQEVYTAVLGETDYKDYTSYISMYTDIFDQAPDNEEYIRSQYDLVGGRVATEKDELMIVLNSDSESTDLVLAQLGYLTQDEFLNFAYKAVDDEEHYKSDYDVSEISVDKILGKEFTWYPNDSLYYQNEKPSDQYELFTSEFGNCDYIYRAYNDDNALEDGLPLKVVGVLKPKATISYGCLSSGIYYTQKLAEYAIEKNKDSEIVQYAEEKGGTISSGYYTVSLDSGNTEMKIPTGVAYQYSYVYDNWSSGGIGFVGSSSSGGLFSSLISSVMGGTLGTSIDLKTMSVREFGGSELPNHIYIYPLNFDSKNLVTDYLDEWNTAHEDAQIAYTDSLELIINMINEMIDIITYALVAFTSISLVVSSVMIGVITYVSVVERTKEIGVLRSLGARKLDVSNLFNAETFIIGLLAGVVGVVITYLISIPANLILGSLTGIYSLLSLPIGQAFIMICVSFALTMISGLIPARAAAKKDPVIALRTE